MKRGPARLVAAAALAAWMQAAGAEWQCHSGAPGGPQELLVRAERIYPTQLLGVLRVSGRVLLVNSTDDGWSERVRQGLMELRLAEPDITAARRFQASAAGASAADVPPGEFACLERVRAARHGLTLNAGGNVMLAAGKSVHLVDPYETAIVVVVRATGGEPLDFREILALSGRSGIYAGLAGKREQPAAAPAVRRQDDAIVVALGPTGRLGEVVVTPRIPDGRVEEKPANAAAPAPPPAPAVVELPAKPLPPEPPAVVAVVEPVREPAVRKPQPSPQSYDDYARTMRAMLAQKRSGGVRSVSEMTYVHPAVEDLRAIR